MKRRRNAVVASVAPRAVQEQQARPRHRNAHSRRRFRCTAERHARTLRLAQRRRPVAEPWNIRPSRGSIGEGDSALTVVDVTGHLPTPRRWGARVSRGGLSMTKDGSFKKVVRRHAEETGQRYTEALTDLEGLEARMFHAARRRAAARPSPGSLRHRRRSRRRSSAQHNDLRLPHRPQRRRPVDRAGVPARSPAGLASKATPRSCGSWSGRTIPAERLAVDDAVSDFDGSVRPRHPVRQRRATPRRQPRSSP